MQRVSPFCRTSQCADSEEIDFRVRFSPGFLMQWWQARQDSFRCTARPNSSSPSDFAVFLSSPESFCVLFDITSQHSAEL